jgi:hypothetical protein
MRQFLLLLAFASATSLAHAADLEIVSCISEGGSRTHERSVVKLTVDNVGKLRGYVGDFGGPLEMSEQVKINQPTNVDQDFKDMLARTNQVRDTGINPLDVQQIQEIFISGNSDFHFSLFKVFDAHKKSLGWLVQPVVYLSGCFAD